MDNVLTLNKDQNTSLEFAMNDFTPTTYSQQFLTMENKITGSKSSYRDECLKWLSYEDINEVTSGESLQTKQENNLNCFLDKCRKFSPDKFMTKRNKKLRFSCRKSTTSVDSQKEFNINNKIEQHSEGSTEIDFDTKAVLYNMEQT